MNCSKSQRLLSAMRDDAALAASPPPELAPHLATCPDCRAFEVQLARTAAALRARPVPPGPTPEVVWANVQRTLRQQAAASTTDRHVRGWDWLTARPWQLAGGALAALLLVAVALWSLPRQSGDLIGTEPPPPVATADSGPTTEVIQLSTGLAGASTMVYEDAETGWTVIWVLPEEGPNHAHS